MKDKLEECFDRLQGLEIKASLTNLEILLQTLYDIREMYQEIGRDKDGRAADTDGRPGD